MKTIKRRELIGHSMGVSVIAESASAYPKQTNSLIFIDSKPFMTSYSVFQEMLLYPPLLKWVDIIVSKISFKKNTVSSAYHKEADDESAEGYLKTFKIKNSGSSIFRMFADIGHSKINDSIINSLPKLITWGKHDNWIPIQVGSKYFNKPQTTTVLIDNSGHCPMKTHYNELNHAITYFISNLD